MKPTCVSACVFAVAASLAGCMGTGEVEYAGEVRVTSPELVTVSPGVQVIADADEPLFYSHGFYWLFRDGYWFRSDSYRSGFARVDFVYVPGELRVIDRPQLYVQFRRHMGRERFARPPQQETRTPTFQTPTYQQPTPSPTYPPQPAKPSYPDNYHPNQPVTPGAQPGGINPTKPPPIEKHTVPPDMDHPRAPGEVNRPEDRGNPNAPGQANRPDEHGNPPGQAQPEDRENKH